MTSHGPVNLCISLSTLPHCLSDLTARRANTMSLSAKVWGSFRRIFTSSRCHIRISLVQVVGLPHCMLQDVWSSLWHMT